MNFDQVMQYRALRFKASIEGQHFSNIENDRLLEAAGKEPNDFVKTVCSPISIELFERMNDVLGLLDMTKREFIQAALISALDRADEIIREVNPWESLPESQPGYRELPEGEQ
ncbi:hypothetical protein JHS3_31890 (plasmid) [Jeongeupia sp. HS-3]|uniref:hypothetical protein n=1 Tax=Jeongeupia sp. HS-3 TaxID=1009682 RepID=UPI0018A5B040|nr:hypothetical protein [Jeongeupia sp. HS-3]BCL77453.1 hypothetical protein JHS3_31890 [Jeongeupia sp. HS-3]